MTSSNELTGIHYGYTPHTENSYTLHTRPISTQLHAVIDDLMRLQGGSVLNLGCGDGILERSLPEDRQFNTISIDRDPYAIATLQKTLVSQKREQYDSALVDDITQLSSLENTPTRFNKAVSWRVLHGITPQLYPLLLRKVHSKLLKGGIFHLSAASVQDWKAEKLEKLGKYSANDMNNCKEIMFGDHGITRDDDFYIHFLSLEETHQLARDNNFKVVSHSYFQEPSGYDHLSHLQNTYIYVQLEAL